MIHDTDCIADFIFVENSIAPCAVALVLGGSHPQLAEKAAEVFHKGMAQYILFSGRANPDLPAHVSEAAWLKSIAESLGVPSDSILCEHEAANTLENAVFSSALLQTMHVNTERLILVCKAYHSRRALLTYQHVFPDNTVFYVQSTVDKRGLHRDNWTTAKEHVDRVMGEVVKIGGYFKDKIAYDVQDM